MKIKHLEINNFRSATKINLSFSPQLNLFVGVNGSGKSTVLDALGICLSWLVKRIERENGRGASIADNSLRSGQAHAALAITVTDRNTPYHWRLTKTAKGASAGVAAQLTGVSQLANRLKADDQQEKGWPVIAYYPVNRVVAAIRPVVSGKSAAGPLAVYDNALGGKTNYQSFFEWFRVQDDIVNEQGNLYMARQLDELKAQLLLPGEQRSYQSAQDLSSALAKVIQAPAENHSDNDDHQGRALQVVTRAIEQFVPQYGNLRVKRTPQPHMLIDKNGVTFNLDQLSEGEKNLLSLIGDIARRLAIANPQHHNPLEGEGIILIDEIDLHLHPRWQRLVIPKLLTVFPHCQFFISTHSPQVISHVKPGSIFLLSQNTQGLHYQQADESYGMSLDRIAELIMDDRSRPAVVQKDLDKVFELIERNKLNEAKTLIGKMKADMQSDPELMRAEMLLRREAMKK